MSRVVEIDTAGGPSFGLQHLHGHEFLQPGEIVLTFDDGPWPRNTEAMLAALAAQCTKAIFFPIGKHASWHPDILRQVAAAGHTIGSHTWSHADLSKRSLAEGKNEIEKGFSAIRWALGSTPSAPFFRFPDLKHPPDLVTYLAGRNVGIFSTDIDSVDYKLREPTKVIASVMGQMKQRGKGIVLMHDFQPATAEAAPELLRELKLNGYRIVFVKAKEPVATIASYDRQMENALKSRMPKPSPASSVVRTVGP